MNRPGTRALRGLFALLLFVITLLPLIWVLYRSVVIPERGLTLDYYEQVFTPVFSDGAAEGFLSALTGTYRALLNTLLLSVGTVVLSCLIAIPAAWLIARTDLAGHRRLRLFLLLPYMIPPYLGAIAWINLANPSVGWINRLLGGGVVNIYTLGGIIWVESLFLYTFVYLNCLAAMENTDPSFEEAARVSGASPLQVAWTVTLPLIRPAIFSGAFLVFTATAASFGVPALIGQPGGVYVLTTVIYQYVKSPSLDGIFLGAALSSLLFAVAIVGAIVADRLSQSRRVTSMAGKAARVSRVNLGRWRTPALAYILLLIFVTCFLPLAAIVATSFMKVAGNFEWSNLTLDKYRYVLFQQPSTGEGFFNSLLLASAAATLAVLIGTALAYLKGHPKMRSGMLLDLCVNLPYATPGTILALGLILTWSGFIRLTDTLWILLIAYFAKFLSFAVKAITTNVQQVDVSLEEASRISGAGFTATFARIWIPLLRPGMLASWFLVFMPAFGELTMSVLLVGPGTETIGTRLFYLQNYGDPPAASVLAVLILAFILTAWGLAAWFGPKSGRTSTA